MRKDVVPLACLLLGFAACANDPGTAYPVDAATKKQASSDGGHVTTAEAGGKLAPADSSAPDGVYTVLSSGPAVETADGSTGPPSDAAYAPDSPSGDGGTGRLQGYFMLSFPDLTTNLGPDQIYVNYERPEPFPRDLLELYARQISLYTWPERQVMSLRTEVHVPDSQDGLAKIYLRFTPDAKPRWYLVEVADTGQFVMAKAPGAYMPSEPVVDGGTANVVAARFMTGSYPLLHDVVEYRSTDGKWYLDLHFSEAVDVKSMPLVQLAEPAASTCAMWVPDPTTGQAPRQATIYCTCTASVIRGLSIFVGGSLVANGPNFTVPAEGPFFQASANVIAYRFDLPAGTQQ